MLTKSAPFEFKSLDETGTFEALVAVFNNVDKGGDRINPGAFRKTLAAWKKSGDPIPVIFNHDWGTPDAHIGVVEDAKEIADGLWVKGRLDIADNPVARQVHKLMQRRSLKEFSFGYGVPAGGERRGKDGVNDLLEIDLAEVGPTLKGMNPATELHSVKSALMEREHAASKAVTDELQALKARVDALEKALESKAEPGREIKSPADPLEQKARALVMDVLTEGSKPPTVTTEEQPPRPDMEPDALKRRSRDLIVQLLTD